MNDRAPDGEPRDAPDERIADMKRTARLLVLTYLTQSRREV